MDVEREAMEPDRDAQLMLAVKDGDRKAFAALFERYSSSLHRFVYRFVGNAAIAEELVQEIFFKIYRAAPSYQPSSRFSTFLYRVATNHCLNEVRRADYRRRFDSIDQSGPDGEHIGATIADPNHISADHLLVAQRLAEQMQDILLGLPENQRAALLLHRLEAFSYQEIAASLELSVGAVKSLIHRAKETLRRRLEGSLEKAG